MFSGQLVDIFVTSTRATGLRAAESAEAIEGKGLTGDRYGAGEGTFSKAGRTGQQITLIEIEAIDAMAREHEIEFEPAQARRNLLTRGVPLNHLVDQDFQVGEVVLRGIRLCEPCGHLEKLTKPGVEKALIHRGGLRAEIVRGGTLKRGDTIAPVDG